MRFRTLRFLAGVAVVAFLVLGPALLAGGDSGPVAVGVAQEESPYTPPEINSVDVPSWLEPLEPLARLPLWGQAAVLSAGVAGMFFVVPMVFKWVWNLGDDGDTAARDPRSGNGAKNGNGKHGAPQ
jgi:hypothetical protein